MRLINTDTRSLKDFSTQKKPTYAILSHRWTNDEVTFSDISTGNSRRTSSQPKFGGTIRQTRRDGLQYVWIDTCCIDKQSSAELSEAINSMYNWYREAKYCYVYLHDVDQKDPGKSFQTSDWFTRGWTLQELLAPPVVHFFDRKWRLLRDRKTLAKDISQITGVDSEALQTGDLRKYSIAQKMSWAAKRTTTRPEDRAYCLLGLFDVNMPLLYGEGKRAFLRLQEEIIKQDDDQSIFAWSMGKQQSSGLMAPSPDCFVECGRIRSRILPEKCRPFSMTNRGLSIRFKMTPWSADTYLAYLDCAKEEIASSSRGETRIGIFLRRLPEDDQYTRINLDG